MYKKPFKALCYFLLILCTFACGEYELLEYKKECKRKADSTFRVDVKKLSKKRDSICKVNYDDYYQAALDSLIPARIEEMKKLIAK